MTDLEKYEQSLAKEKLNYEKACMAELTRLKRMYKANGSLTVQEVCNLFGVDHIVFARAIRDAITANKRAKEQYITGNSPMRLTGKGLIQYYGVFENYFNPEDLTALGEILDIESVDFNEIETKGRSNLSQFIHMSMAKIHKG